MPHSQKWILSPKESHTRLIDFLKEKYRGRFSSRRIKEALEENLCLVNGKKERFASRKLVSKDHIEFFADCISENKQAQISDPKRILYEDPHLLAFDKMSGVNSEDVKLIKILEKKHGKLSLLHRLDKETSGVLLFAKGEEMYKKMLDLFKEQRIKKTYYALVEGLPKKKQGIIQNTLGKIMQRKGQSLWGVVENGKGKIATTHWYLVEKGKQNALMKLEPKTGRTHQIRIHLKNLGHPVMGDKLYGNLQWKKGSYLAKRQLLHAQKLCFFHPIEKKELCIRSFFPRDFKEGLSYLTFA